MNTHNRHKDEIPENIQIGGVGEIPPFHPIKNMKNALSKKTQEIRIRYKLWCDKIAKRTGWN